MRIFILGISVLLLLQSCGRGNTSTQEKGRSVEMEFARLLELEEYEGYTLARIKNPWDTAKYLHTYVLLEEGSEAPEGYDYSDILRIPLKNSVVYSAVHNSLIEELGATDAIAGICDSEYIRSSELKKRITEGRIADCGNSQSPNVEKILTLRPGAVLLSPYENSGGHGKLDHAGIPIVECADYMEISPLARAEWMRFYGRLYGKAETADSLFRATVSEYEALKSLASKTDRRPKVLFDRIYGQSWSVPAGRSTSGAMIEDAGGVNIFGGVDKTGSLQLSPEKVLFDGKDADIWLIRYFNEPISMESLAHDKTMYAQFKAYKEGKVYGSDTSESNLFEDQAFHPQWILEDLIGIFHPGLLEESGRHRYYHLLK